MALNQTSRKLTFQNFEPVEATEELYSFSNLIMI